MSNPKRKVPKYCVVPLCGNSTRKSPEKIFFSVPRDKKMRRKWIKVMRRLHPFGDRSSLFCCEDHFDIETDMENYMRYKLVGGSIVKLKKGTVPHKFECQKGKNEKEKPVRTAVQKRDRIKFLENLINRDESLTKVAGIPEEIFLTTPELEKAPQDPLNFGTDDQCLKILKQSKGVQTNRKVSGVNKSTMTDEKYFQKARKKYRRKI